MNERNKSQNVLCRIPFSSRDKFKITVITSPEDPSVTRVIMQGAAEIIIEYCSGQLDE